MTKSFGQKEKTLSFRSKRKGLFIRRSFLKYSWVLILGFLLTALLFPELALGSSLIFTEDFESYDLGDINGQGDWTVCNNVAYDSLLVASDSPYSGSKSLKASYIGGNTCSERVGTQVPKGSMSFWVRPVGGVGGFGIVIGKHAGNLNPLSSYGNITVHSNDNIYWIDGGSNFLCDTEGNYTQITFHWDAEDNKIKYDCQGNTSGWVNPLGVIDFDYFDVFRMADAVSTNLVYVDDISGICSIGACYLCENLTDCWNAGCSWFYNFETDTSSCYEPLGEMECGVFSNCQYCETQETCEAGFNCEWEDYGFGTQCYYKQYLPATTTVEWVVPDLEDCQALSGVEKWLCEIKNFIAGIFYPSQEKLNNLHSILLDFRQKFPFNYINVFKDFLADVEEGIDEEASISIKILGNESNINFNFWNATTTIGGITESLRNIIVDMTTALILLTFLVWVVSFLRRFF